MHEFDRQAWLVVRFLLVQERERTLTHSMVKLFVSSMAEASPNFRIAARSAVASRSAAWNSSMVGQSMLGGLFCWLGSVEDHVSEVRGSRPVSGLMLSTLLQSPTSKARVRTSCWTTPTLMGTANWPLMPAF
jgi:hypothetical protein